MKTTKTANNQSRNAQALQTDESSVCNYRLTPEAEVMLKQLLKSISSTTMSVGSYIDQKPGTTEALSNIFGRSVDGRISPRGHRAIAILNSLAHCPNDNIGPHGQEAVALLEELDKLILSNQNAKLQARTCQSPAIIELHNKLSREYKRDEMLIIGDLDALSTEEEYDCIKNIFGGNIVLQNGENIRWYSRAKYAPQRIKFEAPKNTPLIYRENGDLVDVVMPMDARTIAPILKPIFTRGSDQIIFCAGSAKVEADESGLMSATFMIPFDDRKITDVLLAVHWGGSTGKRSRTTEASLVNMLEDVKFFESVASQRGGEGYDFFIINLDNNVKLYDKVKELLLDIHHDDDYAMDVFAQKYDLLGQYRAAYDKYAQRYTALSNRALEYFKRVQENECFKQNFFVAVPDFFIDIPNVIEDKFDFNQDLHELHRQCIQLEITSFDAIAADIKEKLETWEEFAPKYALLYDPVVKICRGRLLVKGSKAVISIIGRDEVEKDLQQSKCKKYEYAFNEIEFGHCLSMVRSCVAKERAAKTKNQELLNKLLAE